MPPSPQLEIIPLGGLGEFGMNVMLYRYGSDCVVIDAGMMFPRAEHLGVDVIIPDLSYLDECGTIHGVVLTHGHEDHIGALPYLLARHDVPVYATAHARELVGARLGEHQRVSSSSLRLLPEDGESLRLGPFEIETISVAHSIPLAKMVALRTPVGLVLHTADFKLDPTPPGGAGTDLSRLAELGREGVLVLLSDSTNADRPGFTPGESDVVRGLDEIVEAAPHRVVVTMFASNVQRLQTLARLARKHGRRLTMVGTAVEFQADVAERLGLLRLPVGLRLPVDRTMALARSEAMLVISGSQGEPNSALARVSVGRHRDVELESGDLVIHSARIIPGNEGSIGRMVDHLLRRGAEVVTRGRGAPIHVSGHPARDELRVLLSIIRPRYFVPIHGDYRQLDAHARLARDAGLDAERILLAESGDVIRVTAGRIESRERVHVGKVFIDATLERVDGAVLRDRRRIADDGIVVPVVAVDRQHGVAGGYPKIVTRGFVPDAGPGDPDLMADARRAIVASVADATPEERADEAMLKARIQVDLRRFFRRRTQRQPLILPVILEF